MTGRQLLFDIESNGLIFQITKVHCIAVIDVLTDEEFFFGPETISEGLALLYDADTLIGHNILTYDLKALKKVHGWDPRPGTRRLDTLVVSRTMFPALRKEDAKRGPEWDTKLTGSHSLEAWGIRLGEHKAHYEGGWEEYSEEMGAYCRQDIKTNLRLLRHLKPWDYPQAPLDLEHRVVEIITEIEEQGAPFDSPAGQELYSTLVGKRDELERSLIAKFGTWKEIDRQFVAKRDNKPRGITKGQTVTTWKDVVFNPGSRVHIEKKLREAGWKPTEFTPTGRAKIDDISLEGLSEEIPEAKDLIDYLLIQKRLGMLGDGDNAWLKLVDANGKIHANYLHMGTPHSRMAHTKPNIAQVPNAFSLYGKECRDLFRVPTGWTMVGSDLSGAQLRMLAHFIAAFDGGCYADIVLNGDIHTYHQQAAAPLIKSRDNSKTTIYAKLFGAQAGRIAEINKCSRKDGQKILDLLTTKIPGLGKLEKAVKSACGKGWLKGLDGRQIPVDSDRLGLNYLVTGAEAVLSKRWLVKFYDVMDFLGYRHGWDGDFVIMWHVHDEMGIAVRDGTIPPEDVGRIVVECAKDAGEDLKLNIRIDAEYKIGKTWFDVH